MEKDKRIDYHQCSLQQGKGKEIKPWHTKT